MRTVIIIPTYNEKENIEILIPLIFKTLPDGTAAAVLAFKRDYPSLSLLSGEKKAGLRDAYVRAFLHVLRDSTVKRIVMMDADLSHEPMYLPEMLSKSRDFSVV